MKLFFLIMLAIFIQFIQIFAETNSPKLVGWWPEGPCQTIAVDSTTAYIGNGALVNILDISDSNSVSKLGQFITDGFVEQIEIKDSLLFVLNYGDCFGIYNVADSRNPRKLSYINLEKDVIQFFLYKELAFLSADTFGVIIVDVSNPATLSIAGEHKISGATGGIFVKDDIAYVGVSEIGIQILDVSNPAVIDELESFQFGINQYASHFFYENNLLYVASRATRLGHYISGFFHILDISNPLSPVEQIYFSVDGDWFSYITNIFVDDSFAYITTLTDVGDWLRIYNLSNPGNDLIGSRILTNNAKDVFVKNRRCYISDGYSGFKVYDWEPGYDWGFVSRDTLIDQYKTNGPCQSVFVKDDYAYVASDRAGLRVVDISDSQNPTTVGLFDNPQLHWLTTSDAAVNGNYLFLVNVSGGLNVLDISDPLSIQEVAWLLEPLGSSICIKDDYAYIANRYNGLLIFNIKDPFQPLKVFSLEESLDGYDVVIEDSLLFLAGGSAGTKIYSITEPDNPVELATILPDYFSMGVCTSGNILYIAEHSAGLRLFDISDTKNPYEIGQYYKTGSFSDIEVNNNYGVVADSRFGLRIFNLQKPDSIVEVATYKTNDSAQDVFLYNDLIYLADYYDGFYIFDYTPSSVETSQQQVRRFSLYQNYPNPFNSTTHISFELNKSDFVKISIFNMNGQLVEVLTESLYPSGKHGITWNALAYSSGIYFYKIMINDYSEVKKCILLK